MGVINVDFETIWQDVRVPGVILVLALLLAVPAAAAGDDPVSLYSLPMPVPVLPSVIDPITIDQIPSLSRAQLPQISGLPSRMSAINAASNTSNAVLSRAESTLNSTLTSMSTRIDAGRSLITGLRLRLGAPTSDVLMVAQDQSGNMINYTAYDAALQMKTSTYTTTAYLRGLSNLGGVGLNLTFIIIGLGWIAIVNLIDLSVRAGVFLLRLIGNLISGLIRLIDLLIQILSAIAVWIDILTGPFT